MDKRSIAIIASLGVGLLVLIAVVVEHNREPTEDPKLRKYDPPVILTYDAEMLPHVGELAGAIDDIHAALGPRCPVFAIDSERKDFDARVSSVGTNPCAGREVDVDLLPETVHMRLYECKDGTAHIIVQTAITPTQTRLDFGHELGHLLRLADEDIGGSIMNQPPQYDLWPRPTLTPKDREYVRMMLGCP